MQRKRAGYVAGWLCSAALCAGCSPPDAKVAEQRSSIVGQTGDHTVSSSEVVNQYAVLAVDAPAGANSLALTNLSTLSTINPGDVLFVIQMQGALVDPISDSVLYGQVLDLKNAGHYEMLTVIGMDQTNNTVQVRGRGAGGGLQFGYSVAGHTQVITVPQYKALSVPASTVLTAPSWNGSTGGVVVVTADSVQVDGMISASGLGFRGGQLVNSGVAANIITYRTLNSQVAGERGEGVGGVPSDFDITTGRYGRGAAANGGGGGNNINSPGGGGANGMAMGKTWTGQGVMDVSTANYKTAWMLDPVYVATTMFADEAGGGRGGYGCSSVAGDPLTKAPGDPAWACGNRPNLGGLGGRPLPNDVRQRLFFGGGGGAGQENNNNGGAGGNGGGIVFVLARTVSGQGQIVANGAPGGSAGNTAGVASDGPGGGGGGGSVVVLATKTIDTVQIAATGGAGGNHQVQQNPNEGEGGGGGGGGGFAAIAGASTAQVSVAGGAAGKTNSASFASFPMDGATNGGAGATSPVATLDQNFLPPVNASDYQVTLGLGATQPQGYTTLPGYASVTNLGPDPAGTSQVTITVPTGLVLSSVPGGNVSCGMPGPSMVCTFPPMAAGQTITIQFNIDLPRNPQGPFQVNAAVVGGGYDYVATNDQATVSAEIFGYVQFSGNGFGGCSMSNRASGASAAWSVLLMSALLWLARRRGARALLLLLAVGAAQGCEPPTHPMLNLQVMVTGSGSVSSAPGGIQCGSQCQAVLQPSTQIMLTATPDAGQRFDHWEGRCQGTVPQCGLTMVNDVQTTAVFAPIPMTCFDGIMNGSESDIDCGGSCGACDDARSCTTMADCKSGRCHKNQCTSCPIGDELIINGGAEAGPAAANSGSSIAIPGWAISGSTVIAYGAGGGFPTSSDPGPTTRGKNFFMGGQVPFSLTSQGVDLRSCVSFIKAGQLSFTVSAYLGGTTGQDDNVTVITDFEDNQASSIMKQNLGPVLNADRTNLTGLIAKMATGMVPTGTDRALVTLVFNRTSGTDNDGYADNISLVLSLN